jgi:hypothetical protein
MSGFTVKPGAGNKIYVEQILTYQGKYHWRLISTKTFDRFIADRQTFLQKRKERWDRSKESRLLGKLEGLIIRSYSQDEELYRA